MKKVQSQVSRRWFLGALSLSTVLAGCGENKLLQTISDAYKISFLEQKGPHISRAVINNLPYASITAKIGKGPRGLLILWNKDRSDLHWISVDSVVIVTRLGRIVKTSGIPEEIRSTYNTQPDPVGLGLHKNSHYFSYSREIDLIKTNENLKTLKINSNFSFIRKETLKIVEIDFDTILVKETCKAKTVNWEFENFYWVDPADGFVWKSVQHIARSFPPVIIEVLKPST